MLCKKKIAQIARVAKNESFGGSGFSKVGCGSLEVCECCQSY